MFRNTYQKGFLTVFSSTGSKPLATWTTHVKNGHIKRITDCDLSALALEIMGRNVATTYICTPCPGYCSLGIKLPFLTLIVKNLKKFFTFEIQILDDTNQLRRFRVSNYQTATRVKSFLTSMPLCLSPGWNQIQFNLADFVRRAYKTNYVETVRIQMHANVYLRRIFFTDRLYAEEEKPAEYRLFKSIQEPVKKGVDHKIKKLVKEEPVVRPVSPISTKYDEDLIQMKTIKIEGDAKEFVSHHKLANQEDVTSITGIEFEPEDKPVVKEPHKSKIEQNELEQDEIEKKEPSVDKIITEKIDTTEVRKENLVELEQMQDE